MIASLVALRASNIPRQAILLLLGPGFLVGAIEIAQRERDVLRKALQQFDQFGRERVLLRWN